MPSFPYYTSGSNAIDGLYAAGNSGITTNYKATDGTDLGAVCKASMHSSDRRGPVPYYVNGVYTSDLFRDISFNPVSVTIPNPNDYNNVSSGPYSQIITPNLFGTNYNSNNYSISWTYEGNGGNPIVYAVADSPTSNSTAFTLYGYTSGDSGIMTTVKCTITDNLTGESASDFAYITWYSL